MQANIEKTYDVLEDDELEDVMVEDIAHEEEINEILSQLKTSESLKHVTKEVEFKLSKFNLFSFSGDITKWTEFWEMFECSIHRNRS